jgi:putative ABC transport system permease protein
MRHPLTPSDTDGHPDASERLRRARRGTLPRVAATTALGLRMMFHDKPKLVGTTLGVVFAVVLAAQQLGILFGLLQKNTMFVDNAGADIWVCPPGTNQLQPGKLLAESVLVQARATPGVRIAAPLVYGTSGIQRPWGGSEPITLVGVDIPGAPSDPLLGGPWNLVAGDPASIAMPDAIFLEDARREKMGAVNLGSEREVNGHALTAWGFTWGLLPFAPPYAFTALERARDILDVPAEAQHFVLVTVSEGADPEDVAEALSARLPETRVLTRPAFHDAIVKTLLSEQLGVTFGTSTAFGLIIGFIIVALSMFSSVIDNLKEFGTLKAIGATSGDLSRLLIVQSIAYGILGSWIGLGLVGFAAEGIRSANLAMIVPVELVVATPVVMITLCVLASFLALRRVRRLEPGMVFR